jgi:hypothetical protein
MYPQDDTDRETLGNLLQEGTQDIRVWEILYLASPAACSTLPYAPLRRAPRSAGE